MGCIVFGVENSLVVNSTVMGVVVVLCQSPRIAFAQFVAFPTILCLWFGFSPCKEVAIVVMGVCTDVGFCSHHGETEINKTVTRFYV